jgi:hypothetical protein
MSSISTVLIGTAAALLAFDAVTINTATGNSRMFQPQIFSEFSAFGFSAPPDSAHNVVRSGKSDRLPIASSATATNRTTIVLPVSGQPAMSVVRQVATMPAPQTPRLAPASTEVRHPIACEGVVSVLTDVSRQLAPGRCVT